MKNDKITQKASHYTIVKKKKHRIYTLQYKTLIHGIRNNSNTISNRIGAWTTRKE